MVLFIAGIAAIIISISVALDDGKVLLAVGGVLLGLILIVASFMEDILLLS